MSTGKGPDPSEFDPEFVIGEEDEQPSRSGTPRPKEKAEGVETAETSEEQGREEDGNAEAVDKTPPVPEIPPETRARLRKLDKLEPKYSGQFLSNRDPSASCLIMIQNCSAPTA